jgi:hypothetical protein
MSSPRKVRGRNSPKEPMPTKDQPTLPAGNEVDFGASAEQRKSENAKRWPADRGDK